MTFLSLVACGSGQGSQDGGASDEGKAAHVQGKPLSKADLEQAAITGTDLDDYEVERQLATSPASTRTAEPADCTPVAQALGGSSGFAAVARTGRLVSPKRHGHGVSMILSSYRAQDAALVIQAFRTAAKRCETFKDVRAEFRYDEAALQPDPGYGDESVSLRLTQLAADTENEEPVRVPYTVMAVRRGATVAMFTEFESPRASGGKAAAVVPEVIVKTQLNKLGGPTASK
ncbi:hypothetical protein OG985_18470 [Streptomyces sp. NBC_00289]|uniref:hypothetical protein n=1 Tax=Streptomyces sp. NBC_00289 TaxID=2975703 RepID=UPI00325051FB